MHPNWDAFFDWHKNERPVRELILPMADFECRTCGQLDCIDNHNDKETVVAITNCKIEGCSQTAPTHGRYAKLCSAHRNGHSTETVDAVYPDQFGTDRVNETGPANESAGDVKQLDIADSELVLAAREVEAALFALAKAKARLFELVDAQR
jgi:hypothetical protein